MDVHRFQSGSSFLLSVCAAIALAGCGGAAAPVAATTKLTTMSSSVSVTQRAQFVGAFFRAEGPVPYGVFSLRSPNTTPVPYPTPGPVLVGQGSYCDTPAANGASIDSSYVVDVTKLNDLIFLGARWSRMTASQFNIDETHVFGPGSYVWTSLDAAQCISLAYHQIRPVIGLEAGPVEYNANPHTFSPGSVPTYESASDFGQWCGAVTAHEKSVFPSVSQFSLPGNEVNTNPQLFPGGEAQIAAYSKACYAAIKAANSSAFVYGFELNMDGGVNAPKFVSDMVALGCKVGTCYDGIAMHLTLRYPIPPPTTPCYPAAGGDYSMQCVTAIQAAAQAPIHVLISETVYPVPAAVPDEATKAQAVDAAFSAFSTNPTVDGVLYADVDECALYPSGYFAGGCLIDTAGNQLPAYTALQWLATEHFL